MANNNDTGWLLLVAIAVGAYILVTRGTTTTQPQVSQGLLTVGNAVYQPNPPIHEDTEAERAGRADAGFDFLNSWTNK